MEKGQGDYLDLGKPRLQMQPFSYLNKKLEQCVSKGAKSYAETPGKASFLSCWRHNFEFELPKQSNGKESLC